MIPSISTSQPNSPRESNIDDGFDLDEEALEPSAEGPILKLTRREPGTIRIGGEIYDIEVWVKGKKAVVDKDTLEQISQIFRQTITPSIEDELEQRRDSPTPSEIGLKFDTEGHLEEMYKKEQPGSKKVNLSMNVYRSGRDIGFNILPMINRVLRKPRMIETDDRRTKSVDELASENHIKRYDDASDNETDEENGQPNTPSEPQKPQLAAGWQDDSAVNWE